MCNDCKERCAVVAEETYALENHCSKTERWWRVVHAVRQAGRLSKCPDAIDAVCGAIGEWPGGGAVVKKEADRILYIAENASLGKAK